MSKSLIPTEVDFFLRFVHWLLGAAPIIFVVTYIIYALVATAQVGHWPTYGQPDPKDIASLAWLHPVVLASMAAAISTIPVFLAVTAVRFLLWPSWGGRRLSVILYMGAMLIFIFLNTVDNFSGGWIVD